MSRIFTSVFLLLLATTAQADWLLDSDSSSLSFSSVKNATIAEAHTFADLSGQVAADGTATVRIGLESVDTGIGIRDERMREMLFEIGSFPTATFEAEVPLREFMALRTGESMTFELSGLLTLHGNAVNKSVDVKVIKASEGTYAVNSIRPLMISASEFGLTDGIDALMKVAGLSSITPMVPVSFSLMFATDSIE